MALNFLSLALLATAAFAAPSPERHVRPDGSRALTARQTSLSPGAAAVNDNIQGWQDDIANVNGYLNVAASGTESAAQPQDELNRLMALAGLISPTDTTAMTAVTDLMNIFGGVLGNLTDIVNAAGDLETITSAMDQIKTLRCNFVLPDIDQVYAGAVANKPDATLQTTSGPDICPVPGPGTD